MLLTPGQKLGPYEILSPAGAGGMGEVYKARDTRLDRTVAIKVLPAAMAGSEDLRNRFEREAKSISSLNHPNICTLHDIGKEGETDYLVMEYIEGKTLSDKLKDGPLEIPEALSIAIEIADALASAHEKNLIHRDLKPANVMLTREGAKLLDFGLAKLKMSGGIIEGVSGITQTTPLTGTGAIIGTLQYMSPEQLEGEDADARSDIFSFGALLYEMVAGKRAFEGKSQASLIASVFKDRPRSIAEILPMAPPGLDRLISKCMEKEPERRWHSARDLADELRWILQSGSQAGVSSAVSRKRQFRFRLAWVVAALSLAGLAAMSAWVFLKPQTPPMTHRLMLPVGEARSAMWPRISPDGTWLAFRASDSSGQSQVWLRPLNSPDTYPLQGTIGANRPFWSPDSRFLAFFQGDQLKKIPVTGGPAQVICKVSGGSDGSWGNSDLILFDDAFGDSLQLVSATGGSATGATSLASGEQFHGWPWFLPDGNSFLFVSADSLSLPTSNLLLKVGFIDSDQTVILARIDSRPEYSESGHILYVKDGIFVAHPFDAENLKFVGEPIPIDEGVSVTNWGANFGVSANGTLVYQKGSVSEKSALVWVNRSGDVLDTIGELAAYGDFDISPSGDHLVYSIADPKMNTEDIWTYDLRRGVPTKLTFDDAQDIMPLWAPDGEQIIFASNRGGRYRIMRKMANGTGEAEIIHFPENATIVLPGCWSPDGKILYINELRDDWTIGELEYTTEERSVNYLSISSLNYTYSVSPDGRFMAYVSEESGGFEVYVRETGKSGGKWQISKNGGDGAIWSENGTELFYEKDNHIMAVTIDTENGFRAGIPEELFETDINKRGIAGPRYQPSPDGQRFLMNINTDRRLRGDFTVIVNWFVELKNR